MASASCDLAHAKDVDGQDKPGHDVSRDAPVMLYYAWPASLESMPRSMPIFFIALAYLPSVSWPKISSESAVQCSQPFWLISCSSWPGAQPAYPSAMIALAGP